MRLPLTKFPQYRTYVPFAQWSPEALGAGFILPFALTNSSRFRSADSPPGWRFSRLPPRSWGPTRSRFCYSTKANGAPVKGAPFALVGLVGLEPMTPTMSTWCSNQLSYNPVHCCNSGILTYRRRICKLFFTPGTFYAAPAGHKPDNSGFPACVRFYPRLS